MDTENDIVEPVETPVTVTLPDDVPANDNGDTEPGDVQAANDNGANAESRRERRAEKARSFREQRERADAAERRAVAAEQERRVMADQIAELRGRTAEIQRQQYATQGDPHEKQLAELSTKAKRHLATAANAKDQATADAELDAYHSAQRDAAVLVARREMQAEMRRMEQSRPDPEQAGMKVALSSEYPWLASNEPARNAADAYIALLISRDKRPVNLATYREACALAAKDFGLGGAVERPSEARRAAYAGVTARTGADAGDGRNALQMASGDVEKTKKMAQYLYPSDEPDVAYQKWLKNVGSKIARK